MSWIAVSLLSYFLFALVSIFDKYFLSTAIPDPKLYSFYIGFLGFLIVFFIPFVHFSLPSYNLLFLSLVAGFLFLYALFWLYKSFRRFEISRVVPAVGALTPIFTLFLAYLFSQGRAILSSHQALALFLLIVGSFFLTLERKKAIGFQSFLFSCLTAFLFSLAITLSKIVYENVPFWTALILMRAGGLLLAFLFLFDNNLRREVLEKKGLEVKSNVFLFLFNQAIGATANILQNFAIFLAPLAGVAIINALQGAEYLFLFLFVLFLSQKHSHWVKEKMGRETVFQKLLAVLIIIGGLFLLYV